MGNILPAVNEISTKKIKRGAHTSVDQNAISERESAIRKETTTPAHKKLTAKRIDTIFV